MLFQKRVAVAVPPPAIQKATELRATQRPLAEDRVVENCGKFHIVLRNVCRVPSPALGDGFVIARIGEEVTDRSAAAAALCRVAADPAVMRGQRFRFVAIKGRKLLLAATGRRREWLRKWLPIFQFDRGMLVRLGELGFTSARGWSMKLPSARPARPVDGIVASLRGATISQGRGWIGGQFVKGLIHGPISLEGLPGPEWVQRKGLGTPTGDVLEWHEIRSLGVHRGGCDLQSVLFSARDPAGAIRKDAKRLSKLTALDLLPRRERIKARYFGAALLLGPQALGALLRRFAWPGSRGFVVLADPRVRRGSIAVSTHAADLLRVSERTKCLHVLRHPASPVGNVVPYDLDPRAASIEGCETPFIVLHPEDPQWRLLGGDYDGDFAVVSKRAPFAYTPLLQADVYAAQGKEPCAVTGGKLDLPLTLYQMAEGISDLVGQAVLSGQRLVEAWAVSRELRVWVGSIAQTCISSIKHSMDEPRLREELGKLRTMVRGLAPEGGYVIDALRDVVASKSWTPLEEWDAVNPVPTGIAGVLAERALEVHRILHQCDWLRASRVGLPAPLKAECQRQLLADPQASNHKAFVAEWYRGFLALLRDKEHATGSESAALSARLQELKDELAVDVAEGRTSWPAVVLGVSARMAALLAPVEWLEATHAGIKEFVVELRDSPQDGEYDPMVLVSFGNEAARTLDFAAGSAARVEIRSIGGHAYILRVIERAEMPDLSQATDDELEDLVL